MKFKVGDKVYVRCGEETRKRYCLADLMFELQNEPQEITGISYDNKGYIVSGWVFAEDDLSHTPFIDIYDGLYKESELIATSHDIPTIDQLKISEDFASFMKEYKKEKKTMETGFTIKAINSIDKVIFNDPATIVYTKDGGRYVTKAYKEDFDSEKGLALAILKSFGISYLDLQRLIKSATVQEKKAPKKVNVADVTVEGQSITGEKTVAEKPKKKRAGRQEETVDMTNSEGITYTIHRGKRRGVGQKLQQGDMVLVRLCKVYDWEELEVVRDLIGRPLMVDYIGEHSLRVKLPEQKRTYEFSRNEVDRI